MFTPVIPEGASKPIAPYVHGGRAGNTLYVAGTLSIGPAGEVMFPGDVKGQTRHVIEQIAAVVRAGGGDLKDIVYNMIFITDRSAYAPMNEVYAEYFGANPPPRYCVLTELVRPDFLVEIASIAHLD